MPSVSSSIVFAQTGHITPGHTVVSVSSARLAHPGSFGKSIRPSELLSMPSEHCARQVRLPGVPPHVVPAEQVNAPDANSAPSQLPVGATTPDVMSVKAPALVEKKPSTIRK